MAAVLGWIRKNYGGAEGYLKAHTSLTDEDIRRLRENLIVAPRDYPANDSDVISSDAES